MKLNHYLRSSWQASSEYRYIITFYLFAVSFGGFAVIGAGWPEAGGW